MPKYNILLKDDKGYSYIKVTNENWPRVQYVKQKSNDGALYVGPYTNSLSVKKSCRGSKKKSLRFLLAIEILIKNQKRPCLKLLHRQVLCTLHRGNYA